MLKSIYDLTHVKQTKKKIIEQTKIYILNAHTQTFIDLVGDPAYRIQKWAAKKKNEIKIKISIQKSIII